MKLKELKDKKIDDMNKLLIETKESIRNARFGASGSKSKNVKEIKNAKKIVARILTLINQKNRVK
jgi:ribosomal protein L29